MIKTATHKLVKSFKPLTSPEDEIKLFETWQETRDNKILETIILEYSPIIRRAAKELSNYNVDEEELIAEGLAAMVDAANRFDLNNGARFATYAKVWCKGMMYGFIIKNYFPVNICSSHNRKKLFFSLKKLIAFHLKTEGHFHLTSDLIKELSESHSLSEYEISCMYEMFRSPQTALDAPVSHVDDGDEDQTLLMGDILEDESARSDLKVQTENEVRFQKEIIYKTMYSVLSPKEREIFMAQALAEKDEKVTLEELGKRFKITKERIRQIRNVAHDKISNELTRKHKAGELNPDDFLSIT